MSLKQFNRVCSVTIGAPGDSGILIEALRISFSINRTLTAEANTAEVSVWNLRQETRSMIQTGHQLTLHAGYKDAENTKDIFKGDITRIENAINIPEIETKIQCGDGIISLLSTKSSITFDSKTDYGAIVDKLAKGFKLPIKDFAGLITGKTENGFSFEGYTKDAMNELAKDLGFEWSIQNKEIRITPTSGTDKTQAIVLSDETGLLGSPKRLYKEKTDEADKSYDGWEITALLQPEAVPGGVVELSCREIEQAAQFKIVEVKHTGDTHGDDWKSVLKVRAV